MWYHLPTDDVKSNVTKLVDFYTEDRHSDRVNSQLYSWTVKWDLQVQGCGNECLPQLSVTRSVRCKQYCFNIRVLLCILCTLPVTRCSSKWLHSGLTYKHVCAQYEATSVSLMHLHRDVPICTASVIDEYVRRHPRRIQQHK